MAIGDSVTVTGSRKIMEVDIPTWCSGKTGKVLAIDGDIVLVKLDGVSARELRFLQSELVANGSQ